MTVSTPTAQEVRRDLYEIMREDISFEEKGRKALKLGERYLKADNGHLTRIERDNGHWEAMISTDPADGEIPPGIEFDLGRTYCRRTLASNSPVAVHDAPNQGWADDPAFETHGFHCYHGTTLRVDGEPYGTVCFVATESRSTAFSDDETMFAELITRQLERELETERYEAELRNRDRVLREMYEIMADRHRPFADQVGDLLELGRSELDTAYGTLSEIRGDEYVFEIVSADDDSVRAGDVAQLGATNCETVASTGGTVVLGDVERDAPAETDRAGYTDWGISCYIGAPVTTDGGLYGTFCFYDTEARAGQFTEWEKTLVDLMSRWVSYELQRQQANERLKEQNERLERFAGIVSHDLRNPLAVIQGSLELASEAGESEDIARANEAAARMQELIRDLLALARQGDDVAEGDLESVELARAAEGCWRGVRTENATVRIESSKVIRADGQRLKQVFENLFRNSVEHGGEDVTVRVGDVEHGFYLEDDGVGISGADREQVFETGYSTDTDGTGYGLSIAQRIVDAHGWRLSLTESVDGGARFEITGVEAAAE